MTDPAELVKLFDDRTLITEMKRRGYRVPKKEYVRQFTARSAFFPWDLKRLQDSMDGIHNALAGKLGVSMMCLGALPVREVSIEKGRSTLEVTATVIVEDPHFDWPNKLRPLPEGL